MRSAFKNILRFIFVLLVIAIATLGCFIAYKKYILEEAIIESVGDLTVTYNNGSRIYVDGSKEVTFTVINSSEKDVIYYIEYVNTEGVEKDKINFTLSDGKVNVSDKFNDFNTILDKDIIIKGGEMKEYRLVLTSNIKFSFELNIELENGTNTSFADTLLANNEIKDKPLTKVGYEIATTNEGLIKDVDDNGETYYFRGNVDNNYLKIADKIFRIVRINGDGSIKVVLDGVIDGSKYYDNAANHAFEGSLVQKTLNTWFEENLSDYTNSIQKTKFCNDDNTGDDNLKAHNRVVVDHISSFVCYDNLASAKVALLSVDEMIYAGATVNEDNTNFYLYNANQGTSTYSMSGYKYNGVTYIPFMLNTTGKVVTNESGDALHNIKPVINIIKTASVTGKGTVNDPYVLTKQG